MSEDEKPHPQALAGLGIWAAQTVALLVSELQAQGHIEQSFVDQVATRLGEYDAGAPAGASNAYETVRFMLSGAWRNNNN